MRVKIKHLLRRSGFKPRGGGRAPSRLDRIADLVLDQARVFYRNWPELSTRELPL
jgi:hypothetical protein